MKEVDYSKGIRFECQGSANCCVSRSSYGYVYLSKKDINRLSKFLKLSIIDFLEVYCKKTNGLTHLKEIKKNGDCLFLEKKKMYYLQRKTITMQNMAFLERKYEC